MYTLKARIGVYTQGKGGVMVQLSTDDLSGIGAARDQPGWLLLARKLRGDIVSLILNVCETFKFCEAAPSHTRAIKHYLVGGSASGTMLSPPLPRGCPALAFLAQYPPEQRR